ncbi:MAG: 5-methyltetrahydropteroyltriglutamate--homocysteine S-methyltransferase [Alicyclobacillus sp.]|nr:5-methyltetrahydropteroyltriglutamate--homocysteine S-methyltransferase [Alicyclobacillus sp.]
MTTTDVSTHTSRPPFRADQVGSLLRTARIHEARAKRAEGALSAEALRKIEDEEIRRIVRRQEEIGLTAVTDGEFRRGWWHFDFLEGLCGVEPYVADTGIQFQAQQTKSRGIRVTGRLDFDGHPMLRDFAFLQETVSPGHIAKMTIPSPSMLHFRGTIAAEAYPDVDEFFADLARTYAKAIAAFHAAGCRYLQLDDTAWAYLCSEEERAKLVARGLNPAELMQRYADTINRAVADKPQDLTVTMHICRGNFRSTWIASGGYEPVAEVLFQGLNIDGFFLEYDTDRAGDFAPLRYVRRPDLRIVLGLITSKHGALERPDDIKRRIAEAERFVPLHQLCLSPQCGFASTEEGNLLTEDEQWAKLARVVEVAAEVWG